MASICQYEARLPRKVDSRAPSERFGQAKPLHVLTLTPFYPQAGDDAAGCFVAEPLRFLDEMGIRTSVVAVRPFHRGKRVAASSTVQSATWVRYATPPGMAGLAVSGSALYVRIRALVERLQHAQPVSLIHAHAALPCGHAAALLARSLGIPYVVTVHGRDAFSSRNGGLFARWRERVSKDVYRSAARVICISGKVQEDLLSGVDCRSEIVHNGVDAQLFSPSISHEMNPVVLSVGNLISTKGHETVLRAIAALSSAHPLLRCQIIGDGPERQRLVHLSQQLGIAERVEWLGRQSRASVAKAMQGCSVFVLPSTYEGLGCVYLEAMAAGKPVIGCTGQGIAEIINSGKNGWLVQPDNTEDLAKTLGQLLTDSALRKRMGTYGRQTVIENFTLQSQARRLAEIYQECVA